MTATLRPTESTSPAPAPAHAHPRRRRRALLWCGAFAIALFALVIVSAGMGQLHIPPGEVVGSLLNRLGISSSLPSHPRGDAVLWDVRFPRVTMALLVGAALGAAGAVTQGVFGNPLAEPGVIGVSAGAAVGACAAIVFGWTFFGSYTTAFAAFATALLATSVVYVLSRSDGRTEVVTLILMGVACNAFAAGLIGLLVFLGDTQAREQIVFWQLGSLNGSRWENVVVVLPLVAIGLVGTTMLARKLDYLALGERAARHVGVDVERLRVAAILAITLLVAAGVAFAGIIAFVGLIVPHVVRMLIGPAHRWLVPGCALGGALCVTAADLIARTAVDYADLPLGMLTALIGAPVFVWLLLQSRRQAGGWT